MGKNKKKEYVLDAVLDEETYMAYKSGQAIDNNGLRSPKGSYWPKQPSYREKNHIKEQLKRAGADMAVGATDYVVFGIGFLRGNRHGGRLLSAHSAVDLYCGTTPAHHWVAHGEAPLP